jgi:hypothetical protein
VCSMKESWGIFPRDGREMCSRKTMGCMYPESPYCDS